MLTNVRFARIQNDDVQVEGKRANKGERSERINNGNDTQDASEQRREKKVRERSYIETHDIPLTVLQEN